MSTCKAAKFKRFQIAILLIENVILYITRLHERVKTKQEIPLREF